MIKEFLQTAEIDLWIVYFSYLLKKIKIIYTKSYEMKTIYFLVNVITCVIFSEINLYKSTSFISVIHCNLSFSKKVFILKRVDNVIKLSPLSQKFDIKGTAVLTSSFFIFSVIKNHTIKPTSEQTNTHETIMIDTF